MQTTCKRKASAFQIRRSFHDAGQLLFSYVCIIIIMTTIETTLPGLCVCLLNISHLEHLFVLKTMSHAQWATKVKTIVWISLKLLRCGDTHRFLHCMATIGRPFCMREYSTCANERGMSTCSACASLMSVICTCAEGLHFSAFH